MDSKTLEFQRAQRDISDDEREVLVVFKNEKGKFVNFLLRGDWDVEALKAHDAARAAHSAAIDAANLELMAVDEAFGEAARKAAIEGIVAQEAANAAAQEK